MAERKFRFVSPGIFINEIDNSQLPNDLPDVGPIIVGRAERGPAMRPVRVGSPSEFVEYFGNPIPGGRGDDVWRDGNYVGPTYGAYAAMAYLRAGVGPVNYIRLLGTQHAEATSNYAGWKAGGAIPTNATTTNDGAFGLFLFNSASAGMIDTDVGNGRLAAVFYTDNCTVALSGTNSSPAGIADEGTLGFIASVGAGLEFKSTISDGTSTYTTTFNFDRNSSKYIRKVFNTNPQLQGGSGPHTVTGDVPNLGSKYWLGETFERFATTTTANDATDGFISDTAAGKVYGIMVPLASDNTATNNYSYRHRGFSDPETGWVFSQDTSTNYSGFDAQTRTQNLFKIKAHNHGEWAARSLKISISDIKASRNDIDSYGTFTVQVRSASDSDNVPGIIEQFTNCNLNPSSENYVAKKIGDRYMTWDNTQKRLRQYGEFNNMSKYIYIEMNSNVSDGTVSPGLLPFGFYGPIKPQDFTVFSGSTATFDSGSTSIAGTQIVTYATGSSALAGGMAADNVVANAFMAVAAAEAAGNEFTASFLFPQISTRRSASDGGLSDPTNAYFGIQTTLSYDSKRHDPGYVDYLRASPGSSAAFTPTGNTKTEYSFIFTLDDISGSQGVFVSGSRASNTSLSAINSSHTAALDDGYDKFTMPLWGGFDGIDIQEMEPFNNVDIASDSTEKTSYAYYTVKRAIDTVADPEFVEGNILSVPGVWQPLVTDHVIAVAESRADCLGVIDIENVYTPNTETTNTFENRLGSVTTAVNTLKDRRINTSYACTFYPWVQIRDDISNATIWVPPSVVAIGTFASSEARAELWFAPAGFTRGGLSTGAGGFPVLSCTERLRREDRDDLYTANVNPIATFPSEGIVVFGQKTLQVTPSALDRINVRRLMIFLKKRVSRIASGILFDQNVQTTWTRFKSEVDKFLGSVQARLGLTEFRVILDESTTTPDLVDRNILYAKIFLKPARAIEFIAIDFFITRTGASFDD